MLLGGLMRTIKAIGYSGILIFLVLALLTGCVEKQKAEEESTAAAEKRHTDLFAGDYIPDIETFMHIGYVTRASISKDGRRIFLSPSFTNARQIFRITDGGWPYQLTSFEDGVSWYSLSNDSYYAIVGAAVGGDENAQLYLLDTETGRIEKLINRPDARFGGVVWSEDDDIIYFASNMGNLRDFYIYKLELPDGEPEVVKERKGWSVPIQVNEEGTRLLYETAVTSRDNNFYMLDLESGTEELLTPHDGEYLYPFMALTPDFNTAYLTTNNTPDGITRIAEMNVETNEITFLNPDLKWEVESAALSDDGKYLFWTINEHGYRRPNLKSLVSDERLPVPSLEGLYTFGGFTSAGKMLFSFNNANHPPNAWLWDPYEEMGKRISEVSTMGIDISNFVEPRLIKYKSFDSLEIPAFLYLPGDYTEGPIPFIMDFHGGPEGQFRPSFNRHFNYLLANGFGIMAPNVRGSEGYGKEYLDMDNYKNRLKSVADGAAGAQWLIDNGYTTSDMLGVKGGSYGGYMVMALITEYPDLFAAAMNYIGIVNFVTFLENTAEYRRAFRESEYGPLSDREFLKSISPIHKVDRIQCPLLVVHGENDPRVPVGEARQIISQLKAQGGEVDSLIFPDEGHGAAKLENRLEMYRTMVDFFKKHLK
ncbi:MAG: prolyl oligopeptidase family serine peptidase [candidate division Zixibacteria bacterium]|nr:prolyl oligopeptidase family serine peptidase [candidate division Zixibacteria bacterium]